MERNPYSTLFSNHADSGQNSYGHMRPTADWLLYRGQGYDIALTMTYHLPPSEHRLDHTVSHAACRHTTAGAEGCVCSRIAKDSVVTAELPSAVERRVVR